jgi:hypothetical protein
MAGAVTAAVTVRVAEVLVWLPATLLTTTTKLLALSPITVAGVVYDAAVAPAMAVPPFFHW